MKTLIVVGLIFAVSYLFTRPVFSTHLSLLGFRYLFFSGVEFLLVGYLIGPHGLELVPAPIVASLDPILHLALGWAGLMFGLQFKWKTVRLYPVERYALSFAQALTTTALVGLGVWFLYPLLFPGSTPAAALRAAAIMGVCAGPTAPSSIHYFSRIFGIKGRVIRLLKFVVGVDGIPAVVLLGLFSVFLRPSGLGLGEGLAEWKWLVVATGLGVLLGALLTALIELEFSRAELLLFVLGAVGLASGLAQALNLSAVYLTFFMGVTTANTAWHGEEVHKVAAYGEKPLYLTFLVLSGTLLVFDDLRVLALVLTLVVLRAAGKLLGNGLWPAVSPEPEIQSPFLGLTLLSQGAFAIVLAVDFFFLLEPDPKHGVWAGMITSAVLVAVLVNEVLSPLFIRRLVPGPDRTREETS
jgi:Kef-type K+ transport system membrane component KefB